MLSGIWISNILILMKHLHLRLYAFTALLHFLQKNFNPLCVVVTNDSLFCLLLVNASFFRPYCSLFPRYLPFPCWFPCWYRRFPRFSLLKFINKVMLNVMVFWNVYLTFLEEKYSLYFQFTIGIKWNSGGKFMNWPNQSIFEIRVPVISNIFTNLSICHIMIVCASPFSF